MYILKCIAGWNSEYDAENNDEQFGLIRHYSGRVAQHYVCQSVFMREESLRLLAARGNFLMRSITWAQCCTIPAAGFINYVLASCQASLSHRKQLWRHLASFCRNNTLSARNQLRHLLTYWTAQIGGRWLVQTCHVNRKQLHDQVRRCTNEYHVRTSLSYLMKVLEYHPAL